MKNKICCYCGALAETKDHVPPKSFFTPDERRTAQLITVPACLQCNNSACSFDEIFKLISAICALRLDKCPPDYIASVNRTLGNQKKLKLLIEKAEILNNGERKILIPRNFNENFDTVIRRIVTALYYLESGKILQKTSEISVKTLIGFDFGRIDEVIKRKNEIVEFINVIDFDSLSCKIVKKGVFEYRYGIVPDRPDASVWCLLFRHSLLVACITIPNNGD